MTDEPKAEPKPEKSAEELKGELTRRREENETLKTRLAKLEEGQTKRQQAEADADAARRKKAGEFDGLEADYQGKIAARDTQLSGLTGRIEAFEARDKAAIDGMLDGREDAESIRADLEGIPLERQLGLVGKIVAATKVEPKPRGPTGDPGSGDMGDILVPAGVQQAAEQEATRKFPADLDKQKNHVARFIAAYKGVQVKRKENPIPIMSGPKGVE